MSGHSGAGIQNPGARGQGALASPSGRSYRYRFRANIKAGSLDVG